MRSLYLLYFLASGIATTTDIGTVYNHFIRLTQKKPRTDVGVYKEFILKTIFTNYANSTSCDLERFNLSCDALTASEQVIDLMTSVATDVSLTPPSRTESSDLALLYSETNRFPFAVGSPLVYGARSDVRLRSLGACDRVRDLVHMARGFSTPSYEFIWITGTKEPASTTVTRQRLALPECIGDRGYTHVIERQHPYRVATTAVGFLESGRELNVLSVLHTLQVKIPVANPDVFGIDMTVQNCLAVTLLVFKSPVQPKVLIVPFNPEIDYSYNVIPQFSLALGGDPIQQCSLRAAVTELARVKDADRASFGYSFVEIFGDGDLAVFIRNDILVKAHVELPHPEAELNVARMHRKLIGSARDYAQTRLLPRHSAEQLCDHLVDNRIRILTVSSDSLRCTLPVKEPAYDPLSRTGLSATPDIFWSAFPVRRVRIPAAARLLAERTMCNQEHCHCSPPYRGPLCERVDGRWTNDTLLVSLPHGNFTCAQNTAAVIMTPNLTLVQKLELAHLSEPCSVWFGV